MLGLIRIIILGRAKFEFDVHRHVFLFFRCCFSAQRFAESTLSLHAGALHGYNQDLSGRSVHSIGLPPRRLPQAAVDGWTELILCKTTAFVKYNTLRSALMNRIGPDATSATGGGGGGGGGGLELLEGAEGPQPDEEAAPASGTWSECSRRR